MKPIKIYLMALPNDLLFLSREIKERLKFKTKQKPMLELMGDSALVH